MKLSNICFFVLLLIFIIYIVYIGVNMYNAKIESNNNSFINFTVDLIKGNKTLEDIDNLNVSQDIKDVFNSYYNNHFYKENEEVVVFENLHFLDNIYNTAVDVGNESYIDGVFNVDLYQSNLRDKGLISSVLEATGDVEDTEIIVNEEYNELYYLYNPARKSDISYRVENDKLFVNIDDLTFINGSCFVVYKGFEIEVVRDLLDKKRITDVKNDLNIQSISIFNQDYYDKTNRVVCRDSLKNEYIINFKYNFGKIKSVEFKF